MPYACNLSLCTHNLDVGLDLSGQVVMTTRMVTAARGKRLDYVARRNPVKCCTTTYTWSGTVNSSPRVTGGPVRFREYHLPPYETGMAYVLGGLLLVISH